MIIAVGLHPKSSGVNQTLGWIGLALGSISLGMGPKYIWVGLVFQCVRRLDALSVLASYMST